MNLTKWDSVSKRMKLAARQELKNNTDGMCLLTFTVICNADGEPIVWLAPVTRRIEPSRTAAKVLLETMMVEDVDI